MKTYLLLRDNRMSGPYSPDVLMAMPLRSTDLLWQEGSSTQWEFASQFDELKDHVKPYFTQQSAPKPWPKQETAVQKPVLQPPAFEIKERSADTIAKVLPSPHRKRPDSALWIMGLMVMLFVGAFIVKKLVESSDNNTATMANPVAMQIEPLTDENEAAKADVYRNALTTETVYASNISTDALKAALEGLKKAVKVKRVNDRVAPLETVKDLQLEILNTSTTELVRIDVEVTFIGKNGMAGKTEKHSVYNVPPLSKKTLVVPPVQMAGKFRYKVIGAESAQFRSLPHVQA